MRTVILYSAKDRAIIIGDFDGRPVESENYWLVNPAYVLQHNQQGQVGVAVNFVIPPGIILNRQDVKVPFPKNTHSKLECDLESAFVAYYKNISKAPPPQQGLMNEVGHAGIKDGVVDISKKAAYEVTGKITERF